MLIWGRSWRSQLLKWSIAIDTKWSLCWSTLKTSLLSGPIVHNDHQDHNHHHDYNEHHNLNDHYEHNDNHDHNDPWEQATSG